MSVVFCESICGMEDCMNNLEAMQHRKSVRSYLNEEVDNGIIEQIKTSLKEDGTGVQKGNVRFEIITGNCKEAKTGFLFGIGKINAPAMMVGIYEEKEDLVEIGFRLEREVLFLEKKGYGSCFLGTFNEKYLREHCNMTEKEHVGVVVVFGKADEQSRFMNGTFRKFAGSTKRKSYQEVLLNAHEYKENDVIVDIVKHAIMAPSGNNMQPVCVKVNNNEAVFYIKDNKLIDLGIFLSHFYLYCIEIYDNVKITKNIQTQESVDGCIPMAKISWQERK